MKNEQRIFEYFYQLEKDFNLATKERGAEGWTSYFAENAVMVGKQADIVGKEAILKAMTPVCALPGFSFHWAPHTVLASDDESMVYTYGTYERKFWNAQGEEVTQTGKYTTVWVRQSDGGYKIVHDIGS